MTHPQISEPDNTLKLVYTIASAADDRKAADIVILKVSDVCYLTDYFIIMTGFSKAQVRAISDAIEEKVGEELEKAPQRIVGRGENSWVVLDYGDVIVHVFLPQEREFYSLEAFWGHAERLPLPVSLMRE